MCVRVRVCVCVCVCAGALKNARHTSQATSALTHKVTPKGGEWGGGGVRRVGTQSHLPTCLQVPLQRFVDMSFPDDDPLDDEYNPDKVGGVVKLFLQC